MFIKYNGILVNDNKNLCGCVFLCVCMRVMGLFPCWCFWVFSSPFLGGCDGVLAVLIFLCFLWSCWCFCISCFVVDDALLCVIYHVLDDDMVWSYLSYCRHIVIRKRNMWMWNLPCSPVLGESIALFLPSNSTQTECMLVNI